MEMTPANMARNWADKHGLTISHARGTYSAHRGETLICSGSSYGVLLNRMIAADKAAQEPEPLKHVSTQGPFQWGNPLSPGVENLPKYVDEIQEFKTGGITEHNHQLEAYLDAMTPKVATGELLDAKFVTPTGKWLLSFRLRSHACCAWFHNRSDAVKFSRAQHNAARRNGDFYTSVGVYRV